VVSFRFHIAEALIAVEGWKGHVEAIRRWRSGPSSRSSVHECATVRCNRKIYLANLIVHCVQKKRDQNVFSAISPTKIGRFWWNLVHRFLNKFAGKWCKRFPPHLNNVSTLPCKTWNAVELLQQEIHVSLVTSLGSRFLGLFSLTEPPTFQ